MRLKIAEGNVPMDFAPTFFDYVGDRKIFAFDGEMGAGKTTIIKELCKYLGVRDNITSPTFALVNEYLTKNNKKVHHFDCYRLKDIDEALNIGIEEYLYSDSYCFIEWPDLIDTLLPNSTVDIKIIVESDGSRVVEIN